MKGRNCMISMSTSWRTNAFHSASQDAGSRAETGDPNAWRRPALRDVGTAIAILAVPIVLGTVGLILAALPSWL